MDRGLHQIIQQYTHVACLVPEKIHARLHAAPRLLIFSTRHLGRSMQAACRHSRTRFGCRVREFDNGHLFRSLVGHPIPALRLGLLWRKTADGSPDIITTRVDLAGLAVFRGNEIKLLVETAPIANGNRITLDRS